MVAIKAFSSENMVKNQILSKNQQKQAFVHPASLFPDPAQVSLDQTRFSQHGQALSQFSFADTDLEDVRKGAVLDLGAECKAIEQMQTLLTEAGYPVQSNGKFGPMTQRLLIQFQKDNQIQATGKLGPTTLRFLENPLRETDFGRNISKKGYHEAMSLGGYSSLGLCYTGVGLALEKAGVEVTGFSAYMAAEQLEKHPDFREIKIKASQLPQLPAGAVVVWDRSPNSDEWRLGRGYAHGHISIADGKGHEMSDYIDQQRTSYYASNSFRVFLPKAK